MKNLTIAFLAAVSLMSFAGCKKKDGGGGGDYVAKYTEFKNEMCKCADKNDKACAEKVTQDMAKWNADMAKAAGDKPVTPSEEDAKKMAPITEELGKCTAKAMMAGMTPPAGGDKPADPAAAAAPPAGGDKPADPAAATAPPAGSDKPAGGAAN